MLQLYHSNRLESLADGLALLTQMPAGSPLAPETVLVQSNGMARWLALRLAERNGVCANLRFPYPAAYTWELFCTLLAEVPERSVYNPDILTWRLMSVLPQLKEEPGFEPLAHYLHGGDELARYELARRLADVFDQYLVYRPDWILAWEQGEEDHWQARLWRRLTEAGGAHRAALLERCLTALRSGEVAADKLPARLSVFGLSNLPPPLLTLLTELGRHIPIHLFLLSPTEDYWGDLRSEREIYRQAADADPEALYLATGNKLLASLGRQGRDFHELLLDQGPEEEALYEPPAGDSLLGGLQLDILELRNRGEDGERTMLAAADNSVQVHNCHSRMRELEVLHDQLLALFDGYPDLTPADVVVMTPDIEAYVPYIEAVFGTAEPHRIPYTIADRSLRAEEPVAEAFLQLLELVESRFDADQVTSLLALPAVQRRFDIDEHELPRLHDWIRRNGIRWGVDAAHRAELELPAEEANSWRAGLRRMLLGYALPGDERRLFAGTLPFDEVEGGVAELAGRLAEFLENLFRLPASLAGKRSAADWQLALNQVLERFFLGDEGEETALQAIREALADLRAEVEAGGCDEALSLAVVLSHLRGALSAAGRAGSFLGGGVTFCAMVPMRSIPFEVVCLIGVNDGEYPRQHRPAGSIWWLRSLAEGIARRAAKTAICS
ncbi:exodeoxyribonuclease V subunit gamma [Alkalilimnicola ehrlichii]|uniref:RecBCD enzyme subunit RecC n=1 Tax=Alkalilimnicola ehrlichii TaxID=351052 RepID=A0A3E0WN64_9GAMM|nr:exodeoxyribonuclease V subunit gamma [Alkalilimnicola ehrlichii]RFA27293.1 exodeoxyribonuclease V subunit gamma [Alkalilimnicola ehrlichii]RFA34402.1 exodeoxyribonuclease V subunit gamma [Alkalilimnicola ehrlichii]